MLILVDNYDSFTFNLYQYFGELGHPPHVVRNDENTVQEIIDLNPSRLVISPGPCTPTQAGISIDLITAATNHSIPLLGVCLGHQAIAQALGGTIIKTLPDHGKVSPITHDGTGIFQNIPSPLDVTRYHSLMIQSHTCPKDLTITAQTNDGIIMGVSHKTKPIHGIQFHPESIASQHGMAILKNFCDLS